MKRMIDIRNLTKDYPIGNMVVRALRGVDFTVNKGEFVSIMGASGSGKSTLMNIIGCLDTATEGEYLLEDVNIKDLSKEDYAEIRNRKLGFVFQGFNLLPRTTAIENVELPLLYNNQISAKESHELACRALEKVGLGDRMKHLPNQLSGGQQQRVAIARALVNDPAIVLADEPTGNLDSKTSIEIMDLFQELNEQGMTILLVTHENDISQFTSRKIFLKDGEVLWDKTNAIILTKREFEQENEFGISA